MCNKSYELFLRWYDLSEGTFQMYVEIGINQVLSSWMDLFENFTFQCLFWICLTFEHILINYKATKHILRMYILIFLWNIFSIYINFQQNISFILNKIGMLLLLISWHDFTFSRHVHRPNLRIPFRGLWNYTPFNFFMESDVLLRSPMFKDKNKIIFCRII